MTCHKRSLVGLASQGRERAVVEALTSLHEASAVARDSYLTEGLRLACVYDDQAMGLVQRVTADRIQKVKVTWLKM